MAQNITWLGASYSNVPAVTLPKTGGGIARFTDTSDATLNNNNQMLNGVTGYGANGAMYTGSVVFQTIYSGSSNPASSLGVNGDIYIQTS